MKPAIIAKLAEELKEPIHSNKDGANYPALKFHCDWVAHPILQGQSAQNIVRLFDNYQKIIDEMSAAKDGKTLTADMSFMAELGPTLTMTNFRNEFNTYLRSQGLDPSIPNDNDKWANFLTYYARVIEDCPLRCVSQGLRYTDEVTLKVIPVKSEIAAGAGFRLAIEWSWVSKVTGRETKNQQFY